MGIRCKGYGIIKYQNIGNTVLRNKLGNRHVKIAEIHQINLLVIAQC